MSVESTTAGVSASSSRLVVVKLGSSSVTTAAGDVDSRAIGKLCGEVAKLREMGDRVVVVTSGAIAAGLPALGLTGARPRKSTVLGAAAAVGQIGLFRAFEESLSWHGLIAGQILLAPTDLMFRKRYLQARGTFEALLELGVVPIVNENDAVADDEIRFGDNDRLAALVAHLVEADRLVLLTDTDGLFTADPRVDASATLIEEIHEIDLALEQSAGGPGSLQSTGGMASKLAAAKIATWSGVETVVASAARSGVLVDAAGRNEDERVSVGTIFRARSKRLNARKLWIAFALPPSGRIVVDAGARRALVDQQRSLLVAGVVAVTGTFDADDAVEIEDADGEVFAKGIANWSHTEISDHSGRRSEDLPGHLAHEVVHRDHLVVLPG